MGNTDVTSPWPLLFNKGRESLTLYVFCEAAAVAAAISTGATVAAETGRVAADTGEGVACTALSNISIRFGLLAPPYFCLLEDPSKS